METWHGKCVKNLPFFHKNTCTNVRAPESAVKSELFSAHKHRIVREEARMEGQKGMQSGGKKMAGL